MAIKYWLMKSEPDVFSFDDLQGRPEQTEPWDGVRNYQARNFMMKEMKVGDVVLFYHSNCKEPGVVGLAEVASQAYPDHTSWDKESKYYDPKSTAETPRWYMVDVCFKDTLPRIVTLAEMREDKSLEGMLLLARGQRLSIQPVEPKHARHILKLAKK